MSIADFVPDWPVSPAILIGLHEHRRLTVAALVDVSSSAREVDFLFYELDRAKVVEDDDLPSNVVRLGSLVRYRSAGAGERTAKLVLPEEAGSESAIRLSATSMHGAALLGLLPGVTLRWTDTDGFSDFAEVVEVRNP